MPPKRFVCYVLSVTITILHYSLSIHIPGENVDKNVLTTLGIKTIGWQDEEDANKTSQINVHHNYSRVYVQNGEISHTFSQYSHSNSNQNNLGQQTLEIGGQSATEDDYDSQNLEEQQSTGFQTQQFQTTFTGQQTDAGFNLGGRDNDDEQLQLQSSSNVYQQTHNKVTNLGQQEQGEFSSNQQIYDAHYTGNTLQLDQIMQAESQKQQKIEDLSVFEGTAEHQERVAKNYYTLDKPIYVHGFKYPPDPKDVYPVNKYLPKTQPEPHAKCPKMATGQFVYALSCNQFLNCWKGRGYVQNCAPGTLFNPQTLECDFASKVQCITGPRKPEYGGENANVFSQKLETGCPAGFSGVVPHHSDCSKFINCANGAEHVMDCPPGTLFSLKINNCDFPYKAECAYWNTQFGSVKTDQSHQGKGNQYYEGSQINQGYGESSSHGQKIYSESGRDFYAGQVSQQHGTATGGSYYGTNQGSHGSTQQYGSDSYGEGQDLSGSHTQYIHGGQHQVYDQNQYVHGQGQHQGQFGQGQYQGTGSQTTGNKNSHGQWTSSQTTQYGQNQDRDLYGSQSQYIHGSQSQNQGSYVGQSGQNQGHHTSHGTQNQGYIHGHTEQSHTNQGQWSEGQGQYHGQGHTTTGEQGYNTGNQNQNVQTQWSSQQGTQYNQIQGGTSSSRKCPSGYTGLLPHPSDCSKFWTCTNGQTTVQNCGPGTVFNPKSQVCDFPHNVDCSRSKIEEKPSQNDDLVGSQSQYVHGKQQNVYEQQGQSSNSNQYQGGSQTSNQYSVNGQSQTSSGGYGLNKIDSSGKWSQGSQKSGQARCADGASGLYPHPTICSKFLNCANGITYIQDCGPGTVFNPTSKVCDYPYNVHCDYYGEGMIEAKSVPVTVKPSGTTSTATQTQTGYDHSSYGQNQATHVSGTHLQNWENQNQFGSSNRQGYGTAFGQQGSLDRTLTSQSGYYGPNADQDTQETRHYNKVSQGSGFSQSSTGQASHNTAGNQFIPPSFPSTDINADYEFGNEGSTSETGHLQPPPTKPGSPSTAPQYSRKRKGFCEPHDFRCATNDCVPQSMVCDGIKDCPNGADEHQCEKHLEKFTHTPDAILAVRDKERFFNMSVAYCAKSCLEAKAFQCRSFYYRKEDSACFLSDSNVGLSGALIHAKPYNYYEVTAYAIDCSGQYKCPNKKCIQFKQVCDGVNDCGDRIDEKGCSSKAFGYEIQLSGTDKKHEGRIELKAFGKHGYICDDKFGMRNADVVCKELGFPLGAVEVKGNSYYAQDLNDKDVFYLMDDVICLGNESSIKDCDFKGWGVHNCETQEVVGVVCKTPVENCPKDQWKCDSVQECIPLTFVCDDVFDCTDQSDEASQHCEAPTELRLVNGKSRSEGRVEIRHYGIWGSVCDDDFNDDAAKVVCKYLGYPGSAKAMKDGHFGPGVGPIWLDQVYCQGNETSLTQCVHWNWGEHNCEHSEDVGVICSNTYDNFVEVELNERHNIIDILPETVLPERCGLRKDDQFMEDDAVHYRVVQGSVAKQGDYPWQASLRIKNKSKPSHWCGAVVISSKFVLTAAHCLVGFSKGSYFVVAGDYDIDEVEGTEQEAYIEEFYIHEEFRSGQKMNNDIALVKLKGNGLILTKDIQPICLPSASLEYEPGLNCTISGFGTEQSGKSGYSHSMRAGWIPLQSKEVCQMPHVYGSAITDGMICAGSLDEGVDACEGDSGGPLACLNEGYFTLYGITSWGKHCGHANKPGVYVKVSHYRDWIDKTIKKHL